MINSLSDFWLKNQKIIFLFLFFFSLVAIFLNPSLDPDFGWHFRNGQIIVAEGRFPKGDEFSWTMPGYERAYNYWITEAGFYLLESHNLYWFLIVIFGLISASSIYFAVSLGTKSASLLAKIFVGIYCAILLTTFSGVRPQVVSFLFFSFLWVILISGFWKRRVALILVPVMFIAWANFHYAFILGLFFLILYLALEGVRYFLLELKLWPAFLNRTKITKPQLLNLGWICFFSFLATFLNPYKFLTYKTIFEDFLSQTTRQNIAEWLPLNFASLFGFLLLCYLALVVVFLARSFKKVNFSISCLWLLSLMLALVSIRHLPFLLIASSSLLVFLWPKKIPNLLRQSFWSAFGQSFFVLFALILIIFQLFNFLRVDTSAESLAKSGFYPVGAVSFLLENKIDGKLFNSYRWGGYLDWQLPKTKVFIDGRMSGWKKDDGIFRDYLTISSLGENTLPLLDKWQVSLVLVEKDAPLSLLLEKTCWQKIYEDQATVVFKRN